MMKTLLVLALATLGLSACSGELADAYKNQPRDRSPDPAKARSFEKAPFDKHGITEIGIERTPCFGRCPTYTFIVRSDGTVRYTGTANVKRMGTFTGTLSVSEFNTLAQFIKESGYMDMGDNYSARVTDMPTVFTAVTMNGTRKVIRDYGRAGPATLWAIERLIDSLADKAQYADTAP